MCEERREVRDGGRFVDVGKVIDFMMEAVDGEGCGVALGLVGVGEWDGLELEFDVVEASEGARRFAAEGFVGVEEVSVGHRFECPTEMGWEFTTATPQGRVDAIVWPFIEIEA